MYRICIQWYNFFVMDLHDHSLRLSKKQIELCETLGLDDTDAVLSYYPIRYDSFQETPFTSWAIKEHVTFEARVASLPRSWRHGRLVTTNFQVMMGEQLLKITIFNRPWASSLALEQVLTIQGIYMGSGRVTAMSYDTKPLSAHPALVPVYALHAGIQQRSVRTLVRHVFEAVENEIQDDVPQQFMTRYRLLRRYDALQRIHFPESMHDVQSAVRTLKYEEFLKYLTAVAMLHNKNANGVFKQPRFYDEKKLKQVISRLPYALTPDQDKVLHEILEDLSSDHLMYRLVQGDVGCGKTAVAALGMYACVTSGYQAALLAPTEILARQHLSSIGELLQGTGTRIAVIYSGMEPKEKQQVLEDAADGKIDILIGTHAILQENVSFHRLGMVVADEQQRFGVRQRRALFEKGDKCDFLLMSATPIPRTLAATLFGDMSISTIETMPTGRKIPKTVYIQENSFRSVLPQVMSLLKSGHQLYVICAAVEKTDGYDARNVMDVAKNLTKLFKDYQVGILHGRMSSQEKQDVMRDFASNKIQVLVSTTVVEVGMNVVNATGMIVYDADRFGLSQLHQLRGRVQRGSAQGCFYLLSGSKDPEVAKRLNVLVHSNNGFEISWEDLRLRGPGDILGTRQSGVPDFILGNPVTDQAVIETARKDAAYVMEHQDDPDFARLLAYAENQNSSVAD